ncbi:MAG TPA: hypothetical protein VHZ56_10990 [Devosia sp.]|jgi:hypothetical protein|nr:hypothetical protein [Devosia sp.]
MFVSPFVAALLLGSFWTGVGATAVINHNGGDWWRNNRNDVEITANTSDHFAACHARYRTYDEGRDEYIVRPGVWARCTL